MRLRNAFLPIALTLMALAAACSGTAEPTPAPRPASPLLVSAPPPETLATVAAVLGVAPEPTPTPRPPCAPAAKKMSLVNQDQGGTGQYAFAPNAFSFSVGECVDFSMTGETESHTFTVDELQIDESVGARETATFSFTFDKAGTYRLYCIPHEAEGMVGTITVQ